MNKKAHPINGSPKGPVNVKKKVIDLTDLITKLVLTVSLNIPIYRFINYIVFKY